MHYDLEKPIIEMSISWIIKTNDNKIEQNKAQYNLYRKSDKIIALSLGNVSKYEFMNFYLTKMFYQKKPC